MNHSTMWLTLKEGMRWHAEHGVQNISPMTVILLMDNLEELADRDDQLENAGEALRNAEKKAFN